MEHRDAAGPADRDGHRVASLVSAGLLLLVLFAFAGLLAFGRPLLAVQVAGNVSVYLLVMVCVTVAVWLLSLAYVTRVGATRRRRDEGAA